MDNAKKVNYNNQEYQRHQKQTNQWVVDIQDIMTLKKQWYDIKRFKGTRC